MTKIFIIIPAYNESNSILQVINAIKAVDNTWNIVVVDDCSDDNTVELIQQTDAIVLRHIINRGQGAALKTGTDYAIINGADIIVHFDADGQFVASEIQEVIAPVLNGEADIAFGSRFLSASGGKKSAVPWFKKHVILGLAKVVNQIFLGINLTDPQAGFRAFSGAAAKKINWQQDRMAHCSEIMQLAFKHKLRIREVPITVIYRTFGQKFSGGLKILEELFLGILTK